MLKIKLRRTIAFIAIGCLLFAGFWHVFKFKYGTRLESYYSLPKDSLDVLFIGSSHAYRSIDPSVLYAQKGISAYVLGTPSQPVWNSYFCLRQALRYQSPKLVVMECYKVFVLDDYVDAAVTIKATAGMRSVRDFLDALQVSVEDKSTLPDFILRFPWFHTRYRELNFRQDFLPYYGSEYNKITLGFNYVNNIVPGVIPTDVEKITERKPLTKKNLLYLKKIVQLVRENGSEIVFLIAPFCDVEEKQCYINSVADLADELNVPMINGNLLYAELDMDPDVDFAKGDHLSTSGADKLSQYLADYFDAHYDLIDHRGDPRFDRWDKNVMWMDEVRKKQSVGSIDFE